MKPLDRLRQTIEAEKAIREILQDLVRKVGQGIENKIIMEMVPQYSINDINHISSSVMNTLESKYQTLQNDINLDVVEPRSIYFDKIMPRNCQWSLPSKNQANGSFHDSAKSSLWKSKPNTEDWSKISAFKQLQSIKKDSSNSSLQLNFHNLQPPSQIQNSLRRRKEEQQQRRQKNDSREEQYHLSKSIPTNRQIGTLLQLKKDYTYDYNGGVIPINKLQKIHQPRIDVSYDIMDKSKQKAALSIARQSKMKSKLKRTEIKLEESSNCFFDNKSPFYKNFDIQRKNLDMRQKQIPDKVYNGQLPNYMRILTQEGGIKKRYARYNEKGQISNNSSLLRERLRQNSMQGQGRFRVSTKENQRMTIDKLTFNTVDLCQSQIQTGMKVPRTDRIRIMNQKLRQKIIQTQSRSHTQSDLSDIVNMSNSQLISLGVRKSKNRLPGIIQSKPNP